MINFRVKLDCKLGDRAALSRHHSALLAASMLNNTYTASKEHLFGTGPELYAEQWMINFTPHVDSGFRDLILIYFAKILIGIQNG